MKPIQKSVARAAAAGKSLADAFRRGHRIEVVYDPKAIYTDAGHRGRNSAADLACVDASVYIDAEPFAITVTSAHMSAFVWSQSGDPEIQRAIAMFGVAGEVLADALDEVLAPLEDELVRFHLPIEANDVEAMYAAACDANAAAENKYPRSKRE